MNPKRAFGRLAWVGCAGVLLALWLGLDPYQRVPLHHGYGPQRRHYFVTTLERARDLQKEGSYAIHPTEIWHRLSGWAEELSEGPSPRARAVHRRARWILPVLEPVPLLIRVELAAIPLVGRGQWPLVVEYGVNGASGGRITVPVEGTTLEFRVPASSLFRGDNVVYLYRETRRADPLPWLAVGRIEVERLSESSRTEGQS